MIKFAASFLTASTAGSRRVRLFGSKKSLLAAYSSPRVESFGIRLPSIIGAVIAGFWVRFRLPLTVEFVGVGVGAGAASLAGGFGELGGKITFSPTFSLSS